jgi:hypothetical protein
MYYTGLSLGKEALEGHAGDWKVKEDEELGGYDTSISFIEVMQAIYHSGYSKSVTIISDCNYSGFWPK